MSISSQIEENYFNSTTSAFISGLLSELMTGTQPTQPSISGFLQELLLITPNSTISALSQSNNIPTLVIAKGVELETGQYYLLRPADTLTDTAGTPYRSVTGIQGVTGLVGSTGLQGPQGATGLEGETGVQGITGTNVAGITGVQGVTGVVGLTGMSGLVGPTGSSPRGFTGLRIVTRIQGITGMMGITGPAGITGATIFGDTGLQGSSGVVGPTGNIGITGTRVSGLSQQGETGIDIGSTGLRGLTGAVGIEGLKTFEALSNGIQSSGTSLSYNIIGNTVNINNQQLDIIAWGTSSASGSTTTITLTYGGVTLFSTAFTGVFGAPFVIRAKILRISGSSQECIVGFLSTDSQFMCQRTSTSLDLSQDQLLTLTTDLSDSLIETLLVRKMWQ